ncbi:MAG: GGDEF domain-containing protein [Spirochaetales bacterium]|nr:GGDEF domain-containing protein [Spirochaetales bacterium]
MHLKKKYYADSIVANLYSHPDSLKHFELLDKLGVRQAVDTLASGMKDLEELQNQAVDIFSKESLDDVLKYVTDLLLQKFVPTYLVFVVRSSSSDLSPTVKSFKNLKSVPPILNVETLKPYNEFYKDHKMMMMYSEFEKTFPDKTELNNLQHIDPRIIAPIHGIGGLYGFVVISRKVLDDVYTDSEKFFIKTLLEFTSVSIQNILNRKWAITDGKTGLYAAAYFSERLAQEISRAQRHSHRVALILLDIDYFKNFNDSYGHLAGDRMLVLISDILKSSVRKEDIVSRFGGEEFIIMLPECPSTNAYEIAERIRTNIKSAFIIENGKKVNVTVSLGVMSVVADSSLDPNELIEKVDMAMYASKKNGRNRTTIVRSQSLMEKAKNIL